jgi:hypothetical protein
LQEKNGRIEQPPRGAAGNGAPKLRRIAPNKINSMNISLKLSLFTFAFTLISVSSFGAPLPSGTQFCVQAQLEQFLKEDGGFSHYGGSTIQAGDIVVFTGRPSEPDVCNSYTSQVVIIDPTHQRQPVVALAITTEPVPAGTRASLFEPDPNNPKIGIPTCKQSCIYEGFSSAIVLVAK